MSRVGMTHVGLEFVRMTHGGMTESERMGGGQVCGMRAASVWVRCQVRVRDGMALFL